ncbi:R3H domain-containing protein 4-like [Lingula anatina]|uniref:R3H domain-containing protein 4-like n=1 Tax=Lingula anatina TaxID=7574 RepID=A0A1S3K8N4_LINAN|nr:R3H domain-containing protein 4-like [Lingula anatina]|eukprot:XP_013418611.1 R3H domain-containing protein 4-like [Lingula anatina]
MGVIDETKKLYGNATNDDQMQIIAIDESSEEEPTPPAPQSPRKFKHRPPKSPKPMDWTKNSGRKVKGTKTGRRMDNFNFLLSLVDSKEEFGELDIHDYLEPTMSAFGEILSEEEKMRAWNDFINHSEEEQQQFLQGQQYSEEEVTDAVFLDADEKDNALSGVGGLGADDKRTVHPAFTAEECFKKIDSNLRGLLCKRQLPKGILSAIEEEVTDFFKEWQNSVYISKIANPFERLLLHAVCQYLSLSSKSFDHENARHTQVENPLDSFSPPDVTLIEYLELHSH